MPQQNLAIELLSNFLSILICNLHLQVWSIEVKEQGACALWSLAGQTKTQQKDIAERIGISQLIEVLLLNSEKLQYVGECFIENIEIIVCLWYSSIKCEGDPWGSLLTLTVPVTTIDALRYFETG